MFFDTDLILEATELWQNRAGDPGELAGVVTHTRQSDSIGVTEVEILNEEGAATVGKPVGRYLTLDMGQNSLGDGVFYRSMVNLLSAELRTMLPEGDGSALIVGLGNRAVTPDAIGPWTADSSLVTRHLVEQLPLSFGALRPVAAVAAGVLGTTGIESGELVSSLCQQMRPSVVIAVDALAARSPDRLCRTVQLSDSGIIPGSGVGNARHALTRETLGVPVLAVGVPTVIRGSVLAGQSGEVLDRLIVTPSDIDQTAGQLSKLLGLAISSSLQKNLTLDELQELL